MEYVDGFGQLIIIYTYYDGRAWIPYAETHDLDWGVFSYAWHIVVGLFPFTS